MAGSYNPINNNTNPNIIPTAVENKGIFNRLLRSLSGLGLKYEDMILRNVVGVGLNEDPLAQRADSMYAFFSQRAVAQVLNKKSIPYLDKAYSDKRRILREYSIKDEIREFVSVLADEIIVYDEDKDFCSPSPLNNSYSQDIRDKYQEYFEKIYNRFGFSDGITAWNMTKDFLIDGYAAVEIIWDDTKKNIISFNRMRPETLVPAYEPSIGNIWIQFPEDPALRRIFLDSQIVFISYSTQHDYSETSYVEGLIKPYNQLKIMEQTRIMFNVVNAMVYQKFTIPIKGLPKQRAEEQIAQLIADYSEDVEFDDSLGTLTISGSKHLPYNKQIWFPEGDQGTPNMELVSPQGHNLNEDNMLNWFMNCLKRASKIPFQRFEKENGGGQLVTAANEMTRDEITFGNFISRLRSIIKELIVKPIKLQMCMEFPELRHDEVFLNQVDVIFNTNQIFEEWKKLANMEARANIMTTLLGIMNGEQPYFHVDFLVDKIMKLTPEEIEENKAYWIKSKGIGSSTAAGGGAPEGGGGEAGPSPEAPLPEGGETPAPEGGETPAPEGGGEAGGETPPAPEAGGEAGGEEFEF